MFGYLIIGAIMFAWINIRMGVTDFETLKSNLFSPIMWMATIACVMFWPLVLIWAIHDIIHFVKNKKES